LVELVKGSHFIVREKHYSPRTGTLIYEAISKFAIGAGLKIEETRVSGTKALDIFRTWPS